MINEIETFLKTEKIESQEPKHKSFNMVLVILILHLMIRNLSTLGRGNPSGPTFGAAGTKV